MHARPRLRRPELRERVTAPILLHPHGSPLRELIHTNELWEADLTGGQELTVAGTTLKVLRTPGHAPGGLREPGRPRFGLAA